MKYLKFWVSFVSLLCIFSGSALAGSCNIHYTRTSCPGMEETSFRKCGGNASCTKTKRASNVEDCKKKAIKACGNKRLTITKSKVITADFDGQKLTAPNGSDDFCTVYEKKEAEFNRCEG